MNIFRKQFFKSKAFSTIKHKDAVQNFEYYKSIRIYKEKSLIELLNYISLNELCRHPIFVRNSLSLYHFAKKVLGSKISETVIKNTMGKMFTAGANLNEMERFTQLYNKKNMDVVAFYCSEGVPDSSLSKEEMDESAHIYQQSITLASNCSKSNMVAVKFSALANYPELKALNIAEKFFIDLFFEIDKNNKGFITIKELEEKLISKNLDFNKDEFKEFVEIVFNKKITEDKNEKISEIDWRINLHSFYVFDKRKSECSLLKKMNILDHKIIPELSNYIDRLNSIFKVCHQSKCKIMIDAEQTYLQAGIDTLSEQFQLKYNTEEALIFNTFQNYLKSMKHRVEYEIRKYKELKINLGLKMVRGAYMNEEKKLAIENNYESPINNSYEKTCEMMNNNLSLILENQGKGLEVLVASHNEETVNLVKNLITNKNLDKKNCGIKFAQLLGLSDHLTYSLLNEGYSVYKYIPFGKTHIMIPYLVRRAQESIQMLTTSSLQKKLLLDELKKRIFLRK